MICNAWINRRPCNGGMKPGQGFATDIRLIPRSFCYRPGYDGLTLQTVWKCPKCGHSVTMK